MAFRIAARTILELGAELISSDGIALYELIKNAIDAGSRRVRIDVKVIIARSAYENLLEEIDTHPGSVKEITDAIVSSAEFDEATRLELKQRLSRAPDSATLKARLRDWYVARNFIRILDTGHGMTEADLNNIYLTIGTRSRLKEKERLARGGEGTPPLGEKGVGRLSAMRLGEHLIVRTSVKGQDRFNELAIDWSLFDHSSDALLEEIDLRTRIGEPKPEKRSSGTEILIGGLKADWTAAKLEAVAADEFARLVDPWAPRTADQILRLAFNDALIEIPTIDAGFLKRAHGYCSAELVFVDGGPVLSGRIDYLLRGKEKAFRMCAAELVSSAKVRSLSLLRSLGPFRMEFWWFNRGLLTVKNGYPDSAELKAEIRRWAGGLMLYRDGYRVNPYGGADDDWLELDKSAFGAKGYKLNRQQIIGRVLISWRNSELRDQTNREGLVATPERGALIALLRHVLLTQFKQFVEAEDKAKRVEERTTLETISERVESAEADIRDKLAEIERALPQAQRPVAKQASGLVDELVRYVDEAKELGEQYAEDRDHLVYLAGVGLMVEFVLHELDRATFGTLRTLKDIDASRLDKTAAAAVLTLTDQLETLNKRVANLEALGTVRRQSKSDFDVIELLSRAVDARQGEAKRHHITLDGNFRSAGPWSIRAVPGMFVQIVDNLLANSLYWLKQQSLVENGFRPRVTVNADRAAGVVTVEDNGPGVDPAMADEIFQPFVTRKPAGEGRGLGLYISREVARNQGWTIDLRREGTARPGRFNTFQIDLSGSDAFHKGGIEHVAIIDDGYDAPAVGGLQDRDRTAFRTYLKDAIGEGDPDRLGEELGRRGIGSLQEVLDGFETDECLRSLWGVLNEVDRTTPLGTLLRRLFATYEVDRRDKLATLESLERLVLDITGKRPIPFDSRTRPTDLIEYDLVFLDFYLEAPETPRAGAQTRPTAAARDRSIAFLKELVEVNPRRLPLVMLISSEAQAADLPDFRRHASILASAIQFLPKKDIEGDTLYAQATLLGLVIRRREVTALWDLLEMWRGSVEAAQKSLLNVVRELDLPDYSYLQTYRLTNERLPLAHYLVWLFNGYLSSLVEQQLHDVSAAKLIGTLALTGAVPGRIAPTEAISTLYGAITTSTVPMGLADFAPKAWAGDIFLRVDKWRLISGEAEAARSAKTKLMPEVLAVITPACDLVPERSDNLRAVTTIGGTLHKLEAATQPTTHFVIIKEQRFHVTWDPKWPVTIPIESLNGTTALDGDYVWVGRLRELYHADLQQLLTRDLGRVGLPVVPPLPHWFGLRVLAKVNGRFEEAFSFSADDRAAWIFFNAKDKADMMLHLREDVAWRTRAWVRKRLANATDRVGVKLREKVDLPDFIEALQMPVSLKRNARDLPIGIRLKKGEPTLKSETGEGCDHSLLLVFGDDKDEGASAKDAGPLDPTGAT